MRTQFPHLCLLFLGASLPTVSLAERLLLPPADIDVVGRPMYAPAHPHETLLDVARRFDLGQNEILHANPGVDRWIPQEGSVVSIPGQYILPDAERSGLVLNLPEMRLYYFPKPARGAAPVVITHPISVGRMDWETPLGRTTIIAKQRDPAWHPPKSLKDEAAVDGVILPDVVPAGPDNPLGRFALRLGVPGYLIHSTNKPYGVGMRVTHGCIRMYPEDIETLFDAIPVGTPVQIVNQPVKLGWFADMLYMEIHPALEEHTDNPGNDLQTAFNMIAEFTRDRPVTINARAVRIAVQEQNGIPLPISLPDIGD
ncbi:MAG: L,D-transpeptidase family protein [Gammaproteobacteria bacterium]